MGYKVTIKTILYFADYVENKGFIITMSYGKDDQQTVAACSIFTQMCWLRSFNLGPHTAIVEPFVNGSHFVHTPAQWTAADVQDIQVMRFGDFYDLRHLRLTSKKAKASKLVGWEYFLRRAPRDIIAVTIQDMDGESEKCFGKINRPELACRYGQQNKSQIDYFTSGCNTSEVDNAIDYLKHHDFRIVKHVCLNCGHGLPSTGYSPNDIMDMIMRNNSLRNTTILFNMWTYATNLAKDCQLYRFCSNCGDFNNNEYKKLMPSNRLKHDSKKYLEDVLNATSISVAIMIRTERMFKMLKTGDKVLRCLDSIVKDYADIVSTLSKENDMQTSKPLITIDIGTFGSDSYSISCPEYTNYTEIEAKFEYLLSHLHSGEWTMERYENGLSYAAGGVTESGYIAGIQRVLASQARCLVLYGAGHFQALAEYHYKLQHPNKADQCIYHMIKCGYKI